MDTPTWFKEEKSLKLAQISFNEVLDATKHQDDKVGRFLTAIAFLTTGAIALLFRDNLIGTKFDLHHGEAPFLRDWYPLVAWAAFGFFMCILGAVALLLLTLSVPLRLPGLSSDYGPKLDQSRLFYSYIAEVPADEWSKRWQRRPETIERQLYRQYVHETHNLAERASAKYAHTNEAASLFVLSLLFLGVSIVLALYAYVHGATAAPDEAIDSNIWVAAGVAWVSATHASIQLYARVVHDQRSFQLARDAARSSATSDSASKLASAKSATWLLVTIPGYIACVALPQTPGWKFLGAIGALVAVVASFLLTRPRWQHAEKSAAGPRILLYGVAPIALAWTALGISEAAQLIVAVLPAACLSVLSGWSSRRHDLERKRKVRHAASAGSDPTA